MGKIALIFPGQGSQHVGMGLEFFNSSDKAAQTFNKFNQISGYELTKIMFEGPEEDLKLTTNTQPGIMSVSIVGYELLKEKTGIKADYVAGHSLGEYSALYVAGVLTLDDVIAIVKTRSELMSKAKAGAMTAILGLDDEKLTEMIQTASSKGVITVANYNTPDQTVITGEKAAIDAANELASQLGAKRVIPLAVSGAFHSPLMKDASLEFSKYIEGYNFNNAKIPVITNTDASLTTSGSEFKSKCAEQIYSSVMWKQTISYMLNNGTDTFIEIGPGKVLSGMVKKIDRAANVISISDMKSLEEAANHLCSKV